MMQGGTRMDRILGVIRCCYIVLLDVFFDEA